MKVALNLSLSQSFRQRHRLAWSLPVALIALALLGRMVVSVESDWHQYRTVRDAMDREQGRLSQLAAREAGLRQRLNRPESRDLLRQVAFVNLLIDERQLSFAELAAKVTALLPPQARLAALSLPDSSGEPLVHFGIEGTTEDAVESFLNNLEESQDFADVTVTNQGFEEKGGGAPVSITCTARYVGGRTGVVEQAQASTVSTASSATADAPPAPRRATETKTAGKPKKPQPAKAARVEAAKK